MAEADTLKVFISYSRKDAEAFADELVAALEFHGGFAVTIDRHSIVEGEDWKKRLSALIADADTVVFVVSPGAAASPVCHWEVDEAARLSKRILPVLWLAPGDTPVPERLTALHYTRFDEGRSFMSGFKALVTSLNTDLDWLRDHTKYLTRAMDWDDGGRKANRILSGKDIAEMKAWAARRPRNAPELTPLHLDFLKASEEAETARFAAERQQIEDMRAAQEEREKALAKERDALERAAEAQKAREVEQRRRIRLQRATAAGAIAVVIGAAAIYSSYLQKQAQLARDSALRQIESSQRVQVALEKALTATKIAEAHRVEADSARATAEAERNKARESEEKAVAAAKVAEERRIESEAARAEVERSRWVLEGLQAKSDRLLPFAHHQLCVVSSETTRVIATTPDVNQWDQASKKFWELYRGPMIDLENYERERRNGESIIAKMMISFGRELMREGETARSKLPLDSLVEHADNVKNACLEFLGPADAGGVK